MIEDGLRRAKEAILARCPKFRISWPCPSSRRCGHRPSRLAITSPEPFRRDHAGEVLARDFFVMVTATLRRVYVLLVVDIIVRPIIHWNVP
jgi:hypothetical protein